MRIAAIVAVECGIIVCAPVHDAFWIMAPTSEIDDAIETMKGIMIRAGELVVDIPIGVTVEHVVHGPMCLGDVRKPNDKGYTMWAEVFALLTGPLRATGS
jgi:hypothetical protein